MATYTCITCRVMFADKDGGEGLAAELQKTHYKTDWHRYNLKRKVADLPPVTAENFQQRVLAQREQVLYDYKSSNCETVTGGSGKMWNSTGKLQGLCWGRIPRLGFDSTAVFRILATVHSTSVVSCTRSHRCFVSSITLTFCHEVASVYCD